MLRVICIDPKTVAPKAIAFPMQILNSCWSLHYADFTIKSDLSVHVFSSCWYIWSIFSMDPVGIRPKSVGSCWHGVRRFQFFTLQGPNPSTSSTLMPLRLSRKDVPNSKRLLFLLKGEPKECFWGEASYTLIYMFDLRWPAPISWIKSNVRVCTFELHIMMNSTGQHHRRLCKTGTLKTRKRGVFWAEPIGLSKRKPSSLLDVAMVRYPGFSANLAMLFQDGG